MSIILFIINIKIDPIKKAKNKLFLVFTCNSDILMSINIKINKNNIDIAPMYTNKYDIPINTKPDMIR